MTSLNKALQIAMRGGAVSGLFVVAMSLLGVGGMYAVLRAMGPSDPSAAAIYTRQIPYLIVGYGFGASFVALFAQLGGGIYTKAADVGADLVGKVEAGIPEDDPRNPAVIADLVGDNVGDCAGRGADLFESTAAENIGAMILGVALFPVFGVNGIIFPLVVRAFGLIASIVGIMCVRTKEDGDPMTALNRGYYITSILSIVGFFIGTYWLLGSKDYPSAWINFFICGIVGVLTSIAFVYITQYYTEYKYRPVRSIAEASQTGPGTNIITGFAVGLECTFLPVLIISIAIVASYHLGINTGIEHAGFFGTAVATMGMLGTAAYILAMDTFGPITDNAGGIIEMSKQPDEIRKKTDRLDAVGNTTKALTKGYAIGSAALAAFLLFSAYLDEVRHYGVNLVSVDIAKPEVFVGGLLGATLIFLFSSYAIKAVGKAAFVVIKDVRDQFKEKPGILAGTDKPDYARSVDIVTRGALKEMVVPGLLAVCMPIAVGLVFRFFEIGAEAVAAFLMVGTIAGILMATLLNNSGGAWDNAKKYIETGIFGGKKSEAHKAAVVGDTVGDPFKDTAGPSLHVVIKLLSTITLVLAPLFL
jgi:K(+)-stimulated pyrophosphate-energized sodium pump